MSEKNTLKILGIAVAILLFVLGFTLGIIRCNAQETTNDVQNNNTDSIAVDTISNVEQAPVNVEPFEGATDEIISTPSVVRHGGIPPFALKKVEVKKHTIADEWIALQHKLGIKETGYFNMATYKALLKVK